MLFNGLSHFSPSVLSLFFTLIVASLLLISGLVYGGGFAKKGIVCPEIHSRKIRCAIRDLFSGLQRLLMTI